MNINNNINIHNILLSSSVALMSVCYIYISYFKILFTFTLPALLAVIIFVYILFISVINIRSYLFVSKLYLSILFALSIFFFIYLVINNSYTHKNQNFVSALILFTIFFYCFKNLPKSYYQFILNAFSIAIISSAIFGILQYFDVNFSWELKYAFPDVEDPMVKQQLLNKSRVPGLSYYSVTFGYHLLCGAALILISYFDSQKNKKYIFTILFSLIFLASLLGQNLSAILAIIAFLIIFIIFYLKKYSFFIYLVFILYMSTFLPYFSRFSEFDSDIYARISMIFAGIEMMNLFPFGIPLSELQDAKNSLITSPSFFFLTRIDLLEQSSFHNSFLIIGTETGILGFALYIIFYIGLIFFYLYKYFSQGEVFYYSIVGICFNVAYLFQTIAHNAGPLNGDVYFWMVNGILLGLIERKTI